MFNLRKMLVFVAFSALVAGAHSSGASPVGGSGEVRYGRSDMKGFDPCEAPHISKMKTWFASSPYYDVGIYIGGANRGCAQVYLTPTWVTSAHTQGWSFYLTWVGPQAPCWPRTGLKMSGNPSVANAQGMHEAISAITAADGLGFSGYNVYYDDLEAYDTSDASCRAAVNAFVDGWDAQIRAVGERAGVYGSSCGSAVADWSKIAHPPDNVWIANWNSDPDVWGLACVSDQLWTGGHRLHQYTGGHNETWGGVTINIDADCAYGAVTPHGHWMTDYACTIE